LSKFIGWFGLLVVLCFWGRINTLHALEGPLAIPEVPVKGTVTMLDIGADKCIPCKMMAPIMKELEEEYQGKAAIIFIDVWKHPEQAPKFRIRAIPTQIFYDKDGKEVQRHEGFMDKKAIVAVLEKLGVKL
jgi:thioredoxin 1